MTGSTRGHGLLQAWDAAGGPRADAFVDVARRHHQVRVDIARQLGATVCGEWQVSAACVWSPDGADGPRLYPDLLVHRPLDPDGHLTAPPVLCVEVGAGPAERRSTSAYARCGVDHHWHVDSDGEVVEVSVRVDDEYRRAETLPFTSEGEWVDFGVGVVWLTLPPTRVSTGL